MAALVGMVPDDPGLDSLGVDQLAGGRMANGKFSIDHVVMTCPACRTEIHATLSADIKMDPIPFGLGIGTMPGTASVVVTGMRVSHDCIPQAKRSASRSE